MNMAYAIFLEQFGSKGEVFGAWGAWLTKVGIKIGIVVIVFGLLFCCVIPFIRSMLANAAAKQM